MRRTTITIPSNENRTPQTITTENQLRDLLRLECQKKLQLNCDYRKLQERNLNLIASLDNTKKEMQRLIEENENLRSVTKKSFCNSVSIDDNFSN